LEIADKIGRLSNGTATAEDISEATRLMRERADRMMPNVLRRLKAERRALRQSATPRSSFGPPSTTVPGVTMRADRVSHRVDHGMVVGRLKR
jgi:hypothetical protein